MATPVASDPIADMLDGAKGMFDLFTAYKAAGFSDQQAIYLTGTLLRTILSQVPSGD